MPDENLYMYQRDRLAEIIGERCQATDGYRWAVLRRGSE